MRNRKCLTVYYKGVAVHSDRGLSNSYRDPSKKYFTLNVLGFKPIKYILRILALNIAAVNVNRRLMLSIKIGKR